MRLTLGQVSPQVAQTLNLNKGDSKVTYYINRACEELLEMGRWVGTTVKYRVATIGGRITWPREIQTIEAMNLNGQHVSLQNKWYEFVDAGADCRPHWSGGEWAAGYHGGTAISTDQNEAISFDDICGSGNAKKLKVYGTATEANGARILLQFYDNSGNYIRSNDETEGWVDGEFVAINPTMPQTTVNAVGSWVGVQKPLTNGVVRITELDTVTGLERMLASYAPGETNPSYRRSMIPMGFRHQGCCPASVTVIGKARFIPAINPRDYLNISSIGAIIYMAKSIYKLENNNYQEGEALGQLATGVLDKQLGSWVGAGSIQTPHFNSANTATLGPSNFI